MCLPEQVSYNERLLTMPDCGRCGTCLLYQTTKETKRTELSLCQLHFVLNKYKKITIKGMHFHNTDINIVLVGYIIKIKKLKAIKPTPHA